MPGDEQPLSDQQIKEDGRGDQVPRNDLALDLEAYGDDERDGLLRQREEQRLIQSNAFKDIK